jgi:hypothetical protein
MIGPEIALPLNLPNRVRGIFLIHRVQSRALALEHVWSPEPNLRRATASGGAALGAR